MTKRNAVRFGTEIGAAELMSQRIWSKQFWVTDNQRKITSAVRYGGQMVYVDKDINLVIVKLSTRGAPNTDLAVDTFRAFGVIQAIAARSPVNGARNGGCGPDRPGVNAGPTTAARERPVNGPRTLDCLQPGDSPFGGQSSDYAHDTQPHIA